MTNPSLIFPPAIPCSTGKVWPPQGVLDGISFYRNSDIATAQNNYAIINSAMLFKDKLTNAELQALTTL